VDLSRGSLLGTDVLLALCLCLLVLLFLLFLLLALLLLVPAASVVDQARHEGSHDLVCITLLSLPPTYKHVPVVVTCEGLGFWVYVYSQAPTCLCTP